MARGAELVVTIITDASKAGSGIDQAAGKFDSFKSGLGSLAGPAAAVLGGITALGVGALNAASDVEQSLGALDAVFGESAGQMRAWAADAATSAGLSEAAYAQTAAVIGAQLQNLGVPFDQVASSTDQMIQLGADLAAQFGGSTQQAVDALGSALRGEADPAEKYGLALSQTAINAELAAQGLSGLEGEQLTAAKAAAVMKLATEQAGGALGAYERESDTLAGSQQTLAASWENASAALGSALLPIIQPMVAALADFAKWVQKNAAVIGPLIAAVAALAAGILILNVVMAANPIGLLIAAIAALVVGIVVLWNTNEEFRNVFINGWNQIAGFFSAIWEGMVAIVEGAIAAFMNGWSQITGFFSGLWSGIQGIVAAVVKWFQEAWANVSNFFKQAWSLAIAVVIAGFNAYAAVFRAIADVVRNIVNSVVQFFTSAWNNAVAGVSAVINSLASVFRGVFNGIKGVIDGIAGAFNSVVGAIKNVINWISKIKIPDLGGLFGAGGKSAKSAAPAGVYGAPAVSAYSGPSMGVLTARAAGSSSTVINVNGGLDSADAIARRISQLLGQRAQRTGGVTIARAIR